MDPTLKDLINDKNNKWLFVGGKGGVGKTTTSCSIAVRIANENKDKKILLISTDPAHNTSDTFGQTFDNEPKLVENLSNLHVMEIDGKNAASFSLDDTKNTTTPAITGLLNNKKFDKFINSFPGMDEALAYAQVLKLVKTLEFDRVIFDTAPTGHTLRFLDFPNLMDKLIEKLNPLKEMVKPMLGMMGPMMKNMNVGKEFEDFNVEEIIQLFDQVDELIPLIKDIRRDFKDPTKTCFVCVCIAEFLSVYENERLIQRLMELEIDCRHVVINQLIPVGDEQASNLVYAARSKMQSKYLNEYDKLYYNDGDMAVIKMPLLDKEIRGINLLENFANKLAESKEENRSLTDLLQNDKLKWIFVGGKGGVGKTTTSSSIAVKIAQENKDKNILLISTDPAHNTSDAFNQKFTKEPTQVDNENYKNLCVMEISAEISNNKIPDSVLKSDEKPSLIQMGKDFLKDLEATCPGIDEAMAYYEIYNLIESKYDIIIFDTAPTGHTLRLLNFPTIMEEGLEHLGKLNEKLNGMDGALSKLMGGDGSLDINGMYQKLKEYQPKFRQISEDFKNAEKTTFVAVTIAEFLPLYETERLVQELCKLEIDIQTIVINQLISSNSDSDKQNLLKTRQKMQRKYMEQLDDLYGEDFHLIEICLWPNEIRGLEMLEKFGKKL